MGTTDPNVFREGHTIATTTAARERLRSSPWNPEETRLFVEAASLAGNVVELRELLTREPACMPLRTAAAYWHAFKKHKIDNPSLYTELWRAQTGKDDTFVRRVGYKHVYVPKSHRRDIVERLDRIIAEHGEAKSLSIAIGRDGHYVTGIRGHLVRGDNITQGLIDDLSELLGKPRLWLRTGGATKQKRKPAKQATVPPCPPRWVGIEKCMDLLGVSYSTVRNSSKSGRIPRRGKPGAFEYDVSAALMRLRARAQQVVANGRMPAGVRESVALFQKRHDLATPAGAVELIDAILKGMPVPVHRTEWRPAGTVTVQITDTAPAKAAPAAPVAPLGKSERLLQAVLSGMLTVDEARLLAGK